MVMGVVNSSEYGGSGGSVAVISQAPLWRLHYTRWVTPLSVSRMNMNPTEVAVLVKQATIGFRGASHFNPT